MIFKKPWVQLSVILAIAFFARAVVFHFLGFEILKYREMGFDLPAQHWLAGEGMGVAAYCPTSYRAPGFIFYLISVYGLFGRSALALGIGQIFWGLLVVGLAYVLGRRVFSPAAGTVAACICAVYPYAVYHDITGFYFTAIFSCVMLGLVISIIESVRRESIAWATFSGLLLGIGLLFRGTILIAAPFLALWVVWQGKNNRRKAVMQAVCMACAAIAVLMPWWVRNYEVHGRFVFLTTDGGRALWKSMNSQSLPMLLTDGHIDDTPDPYDMPSVSPMAYKDAVGCGFMAMSESDQDAWYYHKAFVFAISKPYDTARLAWHKFLGYWSVFYFPPLETGGWSFRYPTSFFSLSYAAYTLTYGPVLLFAVIGLFLARRRHGPETLLLLALVLGVSAPHLFFAGYTKYRAPLDPFLIVMASYALTSLYVRFFPKRMRSGRSSPS